MCGGRHGRLIPHIGVNTAGRAKQGSVQAQVFRELPQGAFDTLAIDIFGPLPLSSSGHSHILVIQDMYTRYVHAYALTPAKNTAIGIAEVLVDEYFTQHGGRAGCVVCC